MADFLFEIGLEEVPARMIAGAQAELEQRVVKMLERERLVQSGAVTKSFATPRRLAVWVKDVAARQDDLAEELVGPSVKVAYKDGVATPAAMAFAKKAGVEVSALKTVTNAKGEYLAATTVKAGRGASEVIAAELPKELAGIYWAKNMYWRPGKPERFVRPVRWMVALLGNEVVSVSFGGYEAGAVTYGHRVLFGDAPIALGAPSEYEDTLLSGFVIADVEVRRQRIRKALDKVTRTVDGLRWREDHGLVDKLTQLTEWPSVLMGGFEKEYLALPEEVLVTVMRDHQSYFAVEDKDGKLAPYFLAVLNTETDAAGEAVIRHGNERVLRARFNDARFFWEFDQRVPLVEREEMLYLVIFQKQLGSYHEKVKRVQEIWYDLVHRPENQYQSAPVIDGVDEASLKQATEICKSDLTCELVKEFTELQGVIGGLYAQQQGAGEKVKNAIYYQYNPRSMDDAIPRTIEGCLLSLADRADTIAGMFAIGLEPTGSRDPFALRRAANGIIKIIAEWSGDIDRSLGFISECAIRPYGSKIAYWHDKPDKAETQSKEAKVLFENVERLEVPVDQQAVANRIHSFLRERLEFYLREAKGQAYDVVKAVLAADSDNVRDALARAEAVTAVRGSEDFVAVSAAFKRMKNILIQAQEKGILDLRVEIPSHVIIGNPAQNALTEAAGKISEKFTKLAENHEYVAALEVIATLRPQVDRFFNEVMVMDDDPYVRNSRLSLLNSLVQTFSKIADFSEIVVAG
jgi:glycyl-tRNA synthetase beta chain